ncbi:uncharacterized protein HMPREF1541_00090 [Cyphellophora europaea CBS 101466]|uniref:Endo-1,5-alpha-L-arabinanase A n=1 Tax=Cyphellophora europaea (strain CBS 101466) TaxID=1220924 RepID=W2SDF1_CYPE1|nr:uncharacterized protein HMPREF1541_00090 [Cyphellophora europaea CBS 101466]ETN45909.1 hypothetical protein HMPREF1541_00090 [Cyphellophora europaea CBS 101466]
MDRPIAVQERALTSRLRWRAKTFFSGKRNHVFLIVSTSLLILNILILGFLVIVGFRNEDRLEPVRPEGLSAPELSRLAAEYVLINENFPDPCFIESDDTFYAYATRNGSTANIQVATAPTSNISSWTFFPGQDALPDPGPWTAKQLHDIAVWAPSVVEVSPTSFILYYSALAASHPRRHCIGAATSTSALGPYTPLSHPLVCNFTAGGAIDPQFFHDPLTHKSYLLYKVDGNAVGSGGACGNSNLPNTPTPIMAAPLDPNNLTSLLNTSAPFEVVTNQHFDGAYLENPMLWYHPFASRHIDGYEGAYHLIFNAGCFTDASYRVEHVVCLADPRYGVEECRWHNIRSGKDRVRRPYAGTLLRTGDTPAKVVAPGGPNVALRGCKGEVNQRWLAFHADVHVEWFGSGEPMVGASRRRGFFIAELEYPDTTEGLELGKLLKPLV